MTEPTLVSDLAFRWIITLMTGLVAGTWLVYDALKLYWLRNEDGRNPTIHDKRFGYACGVVIGIIGVVGCFRFHGVI
jgi:hypothetical protein